MNIATIWGANGGMGRALLQLLRDNNWRVIALSRSIDELLNGNIGELDLL